MVQSFASICCKLESKALTKSMSPIRLGLVVLATDMVLEAEWQALFAAITTDKPIDLLVSRLACEAQVTPAALATMATQIGHCASLILPDVELNAMAYGCTSASLVIGEHKVAESLQQGNPKLITSNPFTAVKAALAHINARNLVVLSPYVQAVNEPFYQALCGAGYHISRWGSLDLTYDKDIGSMDPEHLPTLVSNLMTNLPEKPDAVFISCTNFKSMDKLAALEKEYDCYFLSSNQVMAWHVLSQLPVSIIGEPNTSFGRLLA